MVLPNAHQDNSGIISIASVVFSDIVVTGSSSGKILLWKLEEKKNYLERIGTIQIVNCFVFLLLFIIRMDFLIHFPAPMTESGW